MLLLNKVCFESDTRLYMYEGSPDPCIAREQSIGIYDIVSDQGFWAISSTVSHLEVFGCERIDTRKRDGLTSFLMLNVLEAKIFRYNFLKGYNMWQINAYWLLMQINAVIIVMVTKPEFLVWKRIMCTPPTYPPLSVFNLTVPC